MKNLEREKINNLINIYRNRIDYLTSLARYWISENDWETANKYINKTINIQNLYDLLLKIKKADKKEKELKSKEKTLILD